MSCATLFMVVKTLSMNSEQQAKLPVIARQDDEKGDRVMEMDEPIVSTKRRCRKKRAARAEKPYPIQHVQ